MTEFRHLRINCFEEDEEKIVGLGALRTRRVMACNSIYSPKSKSTHFFHQKPASPSVTRKASSFDMDDVVEPSSEPPKIMFSRTVS